MTDRRLNGLRRIFNLDHAVIKPKVPNDGCSEKRENNKLRQKRDQTRESGVLLPGGRVNA